MQSEVIHESVRLLCEKQAESCIQALRYLLAEGLGDGDSVKWKKYAFLKIVKAGTRAAVKIVRLTPNASQDMGDIGYYNSRHLGE
ncbi:hypothetical protein ACXDTG_004781 [Klebsiella pneumoniae]